MKCRDCQEKAMVHILERGEAGFEEIHFCTDHAARYAERAGIPQVYVTPHVPVTVEVTRAQVERGEPITVSLPDGTHTRLKVPLPQRVLEGVPIGMVTIPAGSKQRGGQVKPPERAGNWEFLFRLVPEEGGTEFGHS